MSLSDQIAELEEELEHYQREASNLSSMVSELECDLADANESLTSMADFIEFVDKTNPELRVAYDAAKALEGNKNG
jgi:chromosome segregation ATPase